MANQIALDNKKVSKIVEMIKEKFPERLSMLINEKGMAQVEFADEIGVSENTISNYCKGKTFPHIAYLVLIAWKLGVSVDYLIGFANSKNGAKRINISFSDAEEFAAYIIEASKKNALNIKIQLEQKDTRLGDTMQMVTMLTCTYFDPFIKSKLYPRNVEAADAVLTLVADILPKQVQDKYFVVKGNIYRAYGSEMADNPVYTYSGVDTPVYDYVNQGNSLNKLMRAYNKEKHTLGLISGLSADTFFWVSYILRYCEIANEEIE